MKTIPTRLIRLEKNCDVILNARPGIQCPKKHQNFIYHLITFEKNLFEITSVQKMPEQ